MIECKDSKLNFILLSLDINMEYMKIHILTNSNKDVVTKSICCRIKMDLVYDILYKGLDDKIKTSDT